MSIHNSSNPQHFGAGGGVVVRGGRGGGSNGVMGLKFIPSPPHHPPTTLSPQTTFLSASLWSHKFSSSQHNNYNTYHSAPSTHLGGFGVVSSLFGDNWGWSYAGLINNDRHWFFCFYQFYIWGHLMLFMGYIGAFKWPVRPYCVFKGSSETSIDVHSSAHFDNTYTWR